MIFPVLFLLFLFQDAATTPAATPKVVWKNHAELSYFQTSGNTSTSSVAVKADSNLSGNGDRLILSFRFLYNENRDVESANRLGFNGRYERTVNNRLFLLLQGGYERDKFSGYDHRAFLGPGIGYDVIKNEDAALKIFASALYYDDQVRMTDDSQDYLALSGSVEGFVKPQDNIRLKDAFSASMSTHVAENYRLQNEVGLEVSIAGPLSLGVRYQVQYQNRPPLANVKKTDTSFLTSFIIDF